MGLRLHIELISLNLFCKGEEEGSSRELWRRLKSANAHAQMRFYDISFSYDQSSYWLNRCYLHFPQEKATVCEAARGHLQCSNMH